jgi:hypothetical protein
MYADGTNIPSCLEILQSFIKSGYQRLRAILVASLLIITSSFFGVFSFRIYHLGNFTLRNIFEVIFSQRPPASTIIIGVLVTAIAYGLFFFTNNVKNLPDKTVSLFTKFLAMLATIIGFDLIFLRHSFLNFYPWSLDLNANAEFFITQASTLVLIMFLWIFYPKLAPISTPPMFSLKLPQSLNNFIAWLRLFIASILIILISVIISTKFFYNSDNQRIIFGIQWLKLPQVGAFLAGSLVASITYWPPKFRNTIGSFGIARLIITLSSLFCVGLIYRSLNDPEKYLVGVVGTFILTITFIPLQRTLS